MRGSLPFLLPSHPCLCDLACFLFFGGTLYTFLSSDVIPRASPHADTRKETPLGNIEQRRVRKCS